MYVVRKSPFLNRWVVIPTKSGLAHSSWSDRATALKVARDLNQAAKAKKDAAN